MKTFCLLILTLATTLAASYQIPTIMDPKLYVWAYFNYNENIRFDNTIWTYGTDYIIAAWMTFGILCIWWRCHSSALRNRSIGLLSCYTASVLVGGFCHQFFTSFESISAIAFRLYWTVCVGFVAIAGGFIGSYASNLARTVDGTALVVPAWFWKTFSITMLITTCAGGFSCEQPACDIFLAGVTQFIPSLYISLVLFTRTESCITTNMMIMTTCGFWLNSVLLPFYSLALNCGLQLGTINTMLHFCLTVAWGCQFMCLCWICETVDDNITTKKAV